MKGDVWLYCQFKLSSPCRYFNFYFHVLSSLTYFIWWCISLDHSYTLQTRRLWKKTSMYKLELSFLGWRINFLSVHHFPNSLCCYFFTSVVASLWCFFSAVQATNGAFHAATSTQRAYDVRRRLGLACVSPACWAWCRECCNSKWLGIKF